MSTGPAPVVAAVASLIVSCPRWSLNAVMLFEPALAAYRVPRTTAGGRSLLRGGDLNRGSFLHRGL